MLCKAGDRRPACGAAKLNKLSLKRSYQQCYTFLCFCVRRLKISIIIVPLHKNFKIYQTTSEVVFRQILVSAECRNHIEKSRKLHIFKPKTKNNFSLPRFSGLTMSRCANVRVCVCVCGGGEGLVSKPKKQVPQFLNTDRILHLQRK